MEIYPYVGSIIFPAWLGLGHRGVVYGTENPFNRLIFRVNILIGGCPQLTPKVRIFAQKWGVGIAQFVCGFRRLANWLIAIEELSTAGGGSK